MRKSLRGFGAIAVVLACAAGGCELVADFDRDKIPEPPRDAASEFEDADVGNPAGDAATDGSVPADEDGGQVDEQDGG